MMFRVLLFISALLFGFSVWQVPPAYAQSDPRTVVCPATKSSTGTWARLIPPVGGSTYSGVCDVQYLTTGNYGRDDFGQYVNSAVPCNRPATVECFSVYLVNYQLRIYLSHNANNAFLKTATSTIPLTNTGSEANIHDCYICTVTVGYTYNGIERTTTLKVNMLTKWPHIISDVHSNTAPIIYLSQGNALIVPENQAELIDIESIDNQDAEGAGLTYALTGGDDQASFNIDPDTGILTFLTQPDFSNPGDLNQDNIFELEVTVSDSGELSDTESITLELIEADNLLPALESVSISSDNLDPQRAATGDTITVTVTSAEQLDEDALSATIAGKNIATTNIRQLYTDSDDIFAYTATVLVDENTPRGLVEFNISNIYDVVGNRANDVTSTTDGSYVSIGVSVEEKQHVIADFVVNRMNNMLNNQPDITRFINGDNSAMTGGGPLGILGLNADQQGYTTHFSTSLGYIWEQQILEVQSLPLAIQTADTPDNADLLADTDTTHLTQAQKRSYDMWMQVNGAHSESGDSDSSLWLGYLGGHVFVDPDFLIGGLIQLDWAAESNDYLGSSVEGFGWMAGPYFAAKMPGQNVYLDARAAWGRSDNQLELYLDGTDDDFDTERWLVSAKLSGEIEAINWTIRPKISASYIEEIQKAYTDDYSQVIGEQVFSIGEVRFGPSFTYDFVHDGLTVRPSFGVTGVWNFSVQNGAGSTANTLGSEELRTRVDAGLAVLGSSAWSMDFRGYFDGIGIEDYEAYGGSAKLNYVFH